ncbi:hypothetical protein EQM14_04755 [Caproiciproducens sp. NJN-50]|uniref:hypothetical protein n=1 Tax=Caproiciproducens sp. NJN-50 TaxID=2507162 RepID=UPI000FFE206B|nr:hypothetical protein [Caproiciproducens sp. NJN-50]QAT49138.1 hypothetical protein EQM14_04755 [Caproiciproducens sp. NJN-50]
MKKLTMSRARQLIERELGIKAKELTTPESMNRNPEFPWYELHAGSQTITVSTSGYGSNTKGSELINLSVTHDNSLSYISEYFYTDTLEYCDEYTQKRKYEVLCEKMGISDNDPKYKRLGAEASDAIFRHYHQPKQHSQYKPLALTAGTLLHINNNAAIYNTYSKFFDFNPHFQAFASQFVSGELPPRGTTFKYVGYGKHEKTSDAIFVLQDIKTGHVYLYNAAGCEKDIIILNDAETHSNSTDLKSRLKEASRDTDGKSDHGYRKHHSDLML